MRAGQRDVQRGEEKGLIVVPVRAKREPQMRNCASGNLEIRVWLFKPSRNDSNYFPPKRQSAVSVTRSMNARTLADNSREVG